jgi:hypothetical protein
MIELIASFQDERPKSNGPEVKPMSRSRFRQTPDQIPVLESKRQSSHPNLPYQAGQTISPASVRIFNMTAAPHCWDFAVALHFRSAIYLPRS